ncbi:MAG: thioester reductase domain-containing protein [Coleofasciculus sp. S288]|nr:thioester reductase domain-containing protein [Coleofasciculus sp. S288]
MGTQTFVDLRAEAVLDPAICPDATSPLSSSVNAILLTGATGFLGAFLLDELLQQTQADIYCLVRASNLESAKNKLQSCLKSYLLWDESLNHRIIPVVGDLSQPGLGLCEEDFRAIASQIDVIYHNGAWVHHAYPYSTLKATNVLGTQEVLRLASQIKVKPVHFISTTSVFSADGDSGVKVVREQDSLDDWSIPSNGYAQSKWVAEMLVMLARDRALPISIYRLGRISGHSQTGMFNVNDFLYRLIIGCIQLGGAPAGEIMLDIMPVDYVSKAIVSLSRQSQSLGKAFHLVNPYPLSSNHLIETIRSIGYPLQQITEKEWQDKLLHLGEDSPEHSLYPLIPFFLEKDSQNPTADLQFDSQETLEELENLSIFCPKVDEAVLHTYFSHLIKDGFLEAPPQHEICC